MTNKPKAKPRITAKEKKARKSRRAFERICDRIAAGESVKEINTALALRFAAKGSPPARTRRLLSKACSRASASVTVGGLPSPNSRRLPRMVTRCTQ